MLKSSISYKSTNPTPTRPRKFTLNEGGGGSDITPYRFVMEGVVS
jgi:hypothetical protein